MEQDTIKFDFSDNRTRVERIQDNEQYLKRLCKMAARYKGDDKFLGEVLAGLERALLPFGVVSIDINDIEGALKDGDLYWDTVFCDLHGGEQKLLDTINQRINQQEEQSLFGIILRFWFKTQPTTEQLSTLNSLFDKLNGHNCKEFKYSFAIDEMLKENIKVDIFYNFI